MEPVKLVIAFQNWRITVDPEVKLFFKNQTVASNYQEISSLRHSLQKHFARPPQSKCNRCISILNPRNFNKVTVHKHDKNDFLTFLNTFERELQLVKDITEQCQLDRCPQCECEPEWYFTLN